MAFNKTLLNSINKKYKEAHDQITRMYYREKKLTKEQFDILHELVWLLHEKERYDNGIFADYELPDEVLNSEEFQNHLQERITHLNNRIPELQTLRANKCKGFKYSFEK